MNKLYLIITSLFILSLSSCIQDRVFPDIIDPIANDTSLVLFHYWDFNDTTSNAALVTPKISIGGASFLYQGDRYDDVKNEGSTVNLRVDSEAGSALRLRNPSGDFIMLLPTVGYENIIVSYAATRTNNGPLNQAVSYSTDGVNFSDAGLEESVYGVSTAFVLHRFNFAAIDGANNNPNFKLKIVFTGNIEGTSGNSRFDNLSVDGHRIAE